MSDFLDNLIDRHMNAAPEIMPRLPSIFEPETSDSGFDLTVKEEATVPGETGTLRQPPRAAQPVDQPTIAEPVRSIIPDPTVPIEQEQSTIEVGLNKPGFPLSPRETSTLLPHLHERSQEETREPGYNRRLPQPSIASTVPVIGRVRRVDQEERMSHISPTIRTTAKAQPSISPSPLETPTPLPTLQEGNEQGARGSKHGLLQPSTSRVAPVIPSPVGLERPIPRPEPVINVTIGRIEVRATVSPQKQTPKSESRTPVMSLEEYLRRRSGGHDR